MPAWCVQISVSAGQTNTNAGLNPALVLLYAACIEAPDRSHAVARSNLTLLAAAWYFPTVVLFSLAERKKNNKKKIKYRCE
jgi:hypothetical protein